jgi:hypothetical protein
MNNLRLLLIWAASRIVAIGRAALVDPKKPAKLAAVIVAALHLPS